MTVNAPYHDQRAKPQQNSHQTWVVTVRHGRTESLVTRMVFKGPNAEADAHTFYKEHTS